MYAHMHFLENFYENHLLQNFPIDFLHYYSSGSQ